VGASDAFQKLNPRQREAAQAPSGPLLIIAGAGTGKTSTLAHRVAHLVLEGAAPERILLLTFTRRAALEMTRRASRIVAEAYKGVRLPWSGTFHSVANRLIRRHCAAVGLNESFSVLDRGDAADLMDVMRHELDPWRGPPASRREQRLLAVAHLAATASASSLVARLFASALSNPAPSPRHALPCMHASVCGFSRASFSSTAPVCGAWA
jgi:superfamily I DNA/RNA helicase